MEKPKVLYELEVAHGSIYGKEEETALIECLKDRAPSCGKRVKAFEAAFAEFCGTEYAIAVTSATTGLTLAGVAASIEPDDEVITTPVSWVATSMAFSVLGANLVFCDVDRRTMNLDPGKLESLITPKTKAIVPVHLFGQCCDMERIMAIAQKHGIPVIEDCAHTPGAEYNGKKAGNLGDIGVFSFHQQKNMSTLGEGGLVTTSNKALYDRLLSYRSLCCRIYGGSHKYLAIDETQYPMDNKFWKLHFDDVGYNFRMTDAQAAVGLAQLNKLSAHNGRRKQLAHRLTGQLENIEGLILPYHDPKARHIYHLYLLFLDPEYRLSKTDLLWKLYHEKGIKGWAHYMPIHLTKPYTDRGHRKGECPVAEAAFDHYVTLPIHPRLTDEAIDYMAASIKELSE